MTDKASECVVNFNLLFDVLFFLFKVAPTVGSSYKISTCIILIVDYFKLHMAECVDEISDNVYRLILDFSSCSFDDLRHIEVAAFVNLSRLNLILASKALGERYLLPAESVGTFFDLHKTGSSYFSIISCLFYIGQNDLYKDLYLTLIRNIEEKLKCLKNISSDSEKLFTLLDCLTCLYICDELKKRLIQCLCRDALGGEKNESSLRQYLNILKHEGFYFIDWGCIDL